MFFNSCAGGLSGAQAHGIDVPGADSKAHGGGVGRKPQALKRRSGRRPINTQKNARLAEEPGGWEERSRRHIVPEAHRALQIKANATAAPVPDGLLHGLFEATRLDIPSTYPVLPETYENFVERVNSPDRAHDRIWVAVSGGDPVAASYLRFPPVRGKVWTGYTCSHPEHRGRGLARAIKLQTLAQAIELGVPTVLTDNDSQNAPMLHINEQLGYDRRPGFVSLLKRVDR